MLVRELFMRQPPGHEVNPSEGLVLLEDSACRFADRDGGAAADVLFKAGQARDIEDSMFSLS